MFTARIIALGSCLVAIGLFGAALLYSDGMITPSITVLGAVEGLKMATERLEPFIETMLLGQAEIGKSHWIEIVVGERDKAKTQSP